MYGLLFEMTQLVARFGVVPDPWRQLAVYDVDGFAPFIRPRSDT